MVPNTSRCVDSESGIDSLTSRRLILLWIKFRLRSGVWSCGFVVKSSISCSGSFRFEFYVRNNVDRCVDILFSLILCEIEKSIYVEISVGRRLDVDQFCSTQHHLCDRIMFLICFACPDSESAISLLQSKFPLQYGHCFGS